MPQKVTQTIRAKKRSFNLFIMIISSICVVKTQASDRVLATICAHPISDIDPAMLCRVSSICSGFIAATILISPPLGRCPGFIDSIHLTEISTFGIFPSLRSFCYPCRALPNPTSPGQALPCRALPDHAFNPCHAFA
jgi:hypothetical protein